MKDDKLEREFDLPQLSKGEEFLAGRIADKVANKVGIEIVVAMVVVGTLLILFKIF